MAVPITVKIPEPITAPIPSAVRDHGPKDLLRRCSGASASEISLSMDFLAKNWLARKASLNGVLFCNEPCGAETQNHCASTPSINDLALGRAADYFLHLGLLGAACIVPGLLGRLLLTRGAL
jgi:hypothetical protein